MQEGIGRTAEAPGEILPFGIGTRVGKEPDNSDRAPSNSAVAPVSPLTSVGLVQAGDREGSVPVDHLDWVSAEAERA